MNTELIVEPVRKNSFAYTDLLMIAYEIAEEKSTDLEHMLFTLTDQKPVWLKHPVKDPTNYLYFIVETQELHDGEIPS